MIGAAALPEIVQDLEKLVGITTALAIAKRWAGVHIHIPKNVPDDDEHWLIRIAGRSKAKKIIDVYCGETIVLPRCHLLLLQRRNQRLVEEYCGGKSARVLALEYSITERHVWRILKRDISGAAEEPIDADAPDVEK